MGEATETRVKQVKPIELDAEEIELFAIGARKLRQVTREELEERYQRPPTKAKPSRGQE